MQRAHLGLLAVLVAALVVMHLSVSRIFASVHCARAAVTWTLRRARLAALTDVPRAWSRIAAPARPTALLVLLHGLNGHPIQFEHLRVRAEPGWAVYNPFVHRLGDDALPAVLRPLQAEIGRFVAQHGERVPILLVGQSNGARLCGALEVWLRGVAGNPVFVSAIAGPFRGTTILSLVGGVAQNVFGPEILAELAPDSATATELVAAMAKPTPLHRRFWFYATRQDDMVRPIESATPQIGQGERAVVLDGYDHASLTTAVAEHQLLAIRAFLRELTAGGGPGGRALAGPCPASPPSGCSAGSARASRTRGSSPDSGTGPGATSAGTTRA
jgi:hypothetical protein